MSTFKYSVAYKCKNQEEFEELSKELDKLGYIPNNADYSNGFSYIVTNYAGRGSKLYGSSTKQNTSYQDTLCDSKELFLALASIRDSDEFFKGELVKCIKKDSGIEVNSIYEISRGNFDYNVHQDCLTIKEFDGPYFVSYFTKLSKEEIIEYVNSQKKEPMKQSEVIKNKIKELEEQLKLELAKEEELVVGKWYLVDSCSRPNALVNFQGINNVAYGFNHAEEWTNTYGCKTFWESKEIKITLASKEIIQEKLISEAKKRGFKEGIKVKSAKNALWTIKRITSDYRLDTDELSMDNIYIYEKGKWAEILPSYPDITIASRKVKFESNHIIVGCQSIMISEINSLYSSLVKYNAGKSYPITNIVLQGADVTISMRQLQQITEYYKNK